MFLEIHQPIRHGEIVDVEQRTRALEGRRIFAVRVDHHDMTLRRELADLVEDQRRARRLARAGRTEQREMLAEHRVDIERAANILGWIDRPDLEMRRSEEHTSELPSLMRTSYSLFRLKKKRKKNH